jgi:hypothetical protein
MYARTRSRRGISRFLGSGYAVFKGRGEAGAGIPPPTVSQNSAAREPQLEATAPGPVDMSKDRGQSPAAPGFPDAIPRKEVIQPHLPVRLPCYDFTPVTGPTFDGSLPKGLGHRLRVLPTSVV